MSYSDVEHNASQAVAQARRAQVLTEDDATAALAQAVGFLAKSIEELAGTLRRAS